MFDKSLVLAILIQIEEALRTIADRAQTIQNADEFTGSASGKKTLDSICMLFMATGEALKNIDRTLAVAFFLNIRRLTGNPSSVSGTLLPTITLILMRNRFTGYALIT